ncbi:endothelin-converting enzyme 1-like [Haemaphysalis longicornis]
MSTKEAHESAEASSGYEIMLPRKRRRESEKYEGKSTIERNRKKAAFVLASGVSGAVVFAAALAVFITRMFRREEITVLYESEVTGGICEGDRCVTVSEALSSMRDASADPCENFYAHVCGRYRHPSGQLLSQMQDRMYKDLHRILQAITLPLSGPKSASEKAAALYRACVQVRVQWSGSGVEALRKFMDDVGLSARRFASAEALDRMLLLFFKYQLQTLLGLSLEDSYRRQRQLKLSSNSRQASWFRARSAPGGDLSLFYSAHMEPFGVRAGSARAVQIADRIAQLETRAAVLLAENEHRNHHSVTYSKVSSLDKYTPAIPRGRWASLLQRRSGGVYGPNEYVVFKPSALAYLNATFAELGNTELCLLSAWELLRTLVPLSSPYVARAFYSDADFRATCLSAVARAMEVPLFSHYLFRVVPQATVEAANALVARVREAATEEIQDSVWLDDSTKWTALNKLRVLRAHVGYPSLFSREEELDEIYVGYPDAMEQHSSDFLEHWLSAMQRTISWKTSNHSSFEFRVTRTNAAYYPARNTIVIPAPIIRSPLFVSGGPAALNYGGLGYAAAHELAHALDVEGSMHDEGGRYREWWTPRSRQHFNRNVVCLRRSYGEKGRAEEQDSENLADAVGLSTAFQVSSLAFISAFRERRDERRLPGLPYNAKQLFFVSSCVKWCASGDAKWGQRYAPWWKRCNVPLTHLEDFAEAFECAPGTPMNPPARCSFW